MLRVERLEGGVSAEVLALTLKNAQGTEETMVLRQKAGTLSREARAMAHARAAGLLFPGRSGFAGPHPKRGASPAYALYSRPP